MNFTFSLLNYKHLKGNNQRHHNAEHFSSTLHGYTCRNLIQINRIKQERPQLVLAYKAQRTRTFSNM